MADMSWPCGDDSQMPWQETDEVKERMRFVALFLGDEEPNLAEACRRCGVSRPTGYKWLERYEKEGPIGLLDRPRTPIAIPHRTSAVIEDAVVLMRKKRPTWGPKKLLFELKATEPGVAWPSPSTVGEILKRKGLIRPRRRRVRTEWTGGTLEGSAGPNDLWAIDFKGHFALGNRARCHPLTVTDLCSRFLLKCEGLLRQGVDLVKPQLELTFREFGLPNRLRSDNGPPFSSLAPGGLCPLAVWLIQLGVTPERIRPSSPQENGSHERMHRTLKAEATRPPKKDLAAQQRAFDEFRAIFNRERPHEALGQRPPATLYSASTRPFPLELKHPEYPSGFETRRTNCRGVLSFKQAKIRISKTLPNAPVGLEAIDDDRWRVSYGPLTLGFIEARNRVQFLRALPEPHRTPSLAPLATAGGNQPTQAATT